MERVWPDPAEQAKARRALVEAKADGRLKDAEAQLSAILAEARSPDPWTSRARPTFLYVVYVFILMAMPVGILHVFAPEAAGKISIGVQAWLAAIPEPMWWLFGSGYLGYTAGRSFDKWRRVKS